MLYGGAGGAAGLPGDFMYYSTIGRDFEAGAWGILRVHDTLQGDLQVAAGPGGSGRRRGLPRLRAPFFRR